MFKINRKTEYALRGLRYLANAKTSEPVMIKEIARAADTSPVFLAKIFQLLNAAGIVMSSRGVVGGFRLNRPPGKINLRQILEATEGPVSVNICMVDEEACNMSNKCAAHKAWKKVRDSLNKMLEQITLKDL